MKDKFLLSVVVPMYFEQEVARECHRRLTAMLDANRYDYELVYVNDGSTDGTLPILKEFAENDKRVKVLSFSRNFGHQVAVTAGVDAATGDAIVIIDADLQDPPELIPQMVAAWRNGADIVFAVRESRAGESAFKKATASAYYRLLRRIARVDIPVDTADFRLMSRRATEGLKAMRERSRYMRGLVGWMGLNRASITYNRDPRFAGETKYPLHKMLRLATDGIMSFSTSPLQLATVLGVASAALGFLVALGAVLTKLTGGYVVPGWTSTIVAVLFVGGVQLITLGVIGAYIGRVYDEVRNRPLYLIEAVQGFDDETAEHFSHSPLPSLKNPS
jgi:glycosyltransferase involved in cell wall biosynthesis